MINIRVNAKNLEYDIHALFKSYFPEEEITIKYAELSEESIGVPSFYDIRMTEDEVSCAYIPVNAKGNNVSEACAGNSDVKHGCTANPPNGSCELRETENVRGLERSKVKNALKRCIYRTLRNQTGHELPWGTLTGIRPTKIPMKMQEEGNSDKEIYRYLKDTYYVSDEKTKLCMGIAGLERKILKNIDVKDGYSLYIGIPFCPTTCLYCSFTSYPISAWKKRVDEYIGCLKKELDLLYNLYNGRSPDTIYMGGGTPTTLESGQFEDIIGYLRTLFDLDGIAEFTVEAGRPDSITEDKLSVLKSLGVTRISINPQTMNDETLKVIGRRHTKDDIINAFETARKCGFDNINTDIILGLPGETAHHVRYTTEELKKLAPDSITVHSMAIKRAAGMSEYLKEHEELKSINTPEMLSLVDKTARELNMLPYYMYRQKNMTGNFENVGYAREGCYGIYNILIMEEVQSIFACGAGTVSKRVHKNGLIERCDNVKDVELYMSRLDEMLERKRKLF